MRVSPLAFNHPPAGDRFCAAKSLLQKNTTTQRVVVFFWSGRRGSNSLPGIPRMAEPFAGALPDLLIQRASRRSRQRVQTCPQHSKKNTPSCRMGYSFWSGRRGSNSLPRPWQGRALPDELRPQTQGGLYRIFRGLSTLHFRFARKNQNQGPKALSTPSISPPRRCFQCWDRSSPSSPSCPVRPAPAPRSAAPAVPGYRWS